jgi:hypothetical protein
LARGRVYAHDVTLPASAPRKPVRISPGERRLALISAFLVALASSGLAAATALGLRNEGHVKAFGEVAVQGAGGPRYVLRVNYTVPDRWHRTDGGKGLRQRFGPVGSCRIRITVSAVAVADVREDAVTRVARLLPGSGRNLLDYGTRTNGAFRVFRAPGAKEVNAVLVKPAPSVRQQPTPSIVWLELRARAVVDPRTECHSGGPRTVGTNLGDTLAAARLGGFQIVPRT